MATGHDPQNQRLAGRIGGLVTNSRHDSSAITSSARRAFLARFLVEVDPRGELTEAERERRAEFARRAHFARLAMMSATARAKAARRPLEKRDATPAGAASLMTEGSCSAHPSD